MRRQMQKLFFILLMVLGVCGRAQTLTVSTSGQSGTSGTNWAISGNTLTVTGTANIQASVIQDHLLNTGPLTLEGTGTFIVNVSEAITVASGGNDLVFGTAGNTGAFTANASISINGNVAVYGGIVTVNQNLASTASGANILLQANENIILAASRTIETNGGDITFRSNAGGTPLPSEHAIRLFSGTSLLSNGGNITLGGNFDGTEGTGLYAATNRTGGRAAIVLENATLTASGGDINVYGRCVSSFDDGILFYGNITTTGSGTIGLYGDAFGGNNGSAYFGGMTLWSTTNIETENGNITLKGVLTNTQSNSTAAINFYRATGTANNHVSILSRTGDILISGDAATTSAWGINHNSGGNIYLGSPADGSWTAIGDIELSYSNLINAAFRGIIVNTTGNVSYLPVGTSFTTAQTLPATTNYILAQDASSLTIGKPGNTANITIAQPLTIAGPISIFGNNVQLQQNLTSTGTNTPILIVSKGVGSSGLTNGLINLVSSRNITTNGGDIILWSNAQNRTDGQANNEIILAGNNTLSSNGGKIVLAGGLDDGSNGGIVADGIPDGYAYRGGLVNEAVDFRGNVTLDSDGGEIIIRGEQNGSSEGVGTDNTLTISNAGPITILGKNTTNVSVRLGISNISSTVANAPVSILGTTHLRNGGLISITTQGGDVVLASNIDAADNTTNGYINLRSGLSITSNGGDITLGGGNANGTDYAFGSSAEDWTEGVRLDLNTTLNSGGGNISIKGKSYNRGVQSLWGASGVGFYSVANGTINGGTGTIFIDGYSQTSVSQFASGILFSNTTPFTIQSANTTSDAIILNGFASGASGFAYGIEAKAGTLNVLATASGGGITLNTGNSIANWYDAVFRGPTNILAVDGPISIKGGQLGGVANGRFYTANTFNLGSNAATDITASSSNLLIEFDRLEFVSTKPQIATTGSVTWQPNSASFGATQVTSDFQWNQNSQTMTGLTIGKSGNTATITHQTNPITAAGPVTIHSGALAINAALTAINDEISLFASGNVTQTAALAAEDLSLNGTGNFTLQNSNNNVATLAGGESGTRLGNVAYRDANALEIGIVGTQSGIFASGTVLVETENGNLTLSQDLNTTSNSTDALILNAGRVAAAETFTGGDIQISGSPTLTYGSGGIAKLFSGFEPNSTGLTALVGAANTRFGFDETSNLTSAGLVEDNSYAIYRVAVGTGDLTIVSSGGDAEGTTWSYANGVITTLNSTVNLLNNDLEAKLANGDVSIEAGKVTFSANVTNNTSNAFKVLSKSHILNTNATTITTQGGDVLLAANVDDATDGESAINGQIRFQSGLTITTNGGDIILGGGDNEGSGYAMGQNFNNLPEGIRIDGSVSLNSGGGNIEMRGKTPAVGIANNIGGAGIMFYNVASGSINSGTGTILMDGYSQTSVGNAIAGLFWWNLGAAGTFTIESANTTANAITLNGYSTGVSGSAWGIETEATNTLNILATASGGGIAINTGFQNTSEPYDIVFRGPTNILAVDGPISLKGGQFGGASNGILFISSDLFLGSKASTAVTSSESDIAIEFDRFSFNLLTPKIATTGAVSVKSANAAFGQAFSTNWFAWNQNSQTMSGLTIGKSGNTFDVTHNTPITVAGPISMYGGRVIVASNLTSSADGDIFIKAITGAAPDIQINAGVTVAKTAGTGTLTLQGHGRVNQHGTVTATAPGVLNVVLWSDFDDDNDDGGTDMSGNITTNGGHVWLGGSNSNGGSYTWNGLTVGDGPSVGNPGNNFHALDLAGNVTTNGGDFLAWAGTSWGVNGIGIVPSSGNVINTGSGNITLIANQILGQGSTAIGFQTTGVFTLAPNGGAFPSGLNWNPVLLNGNFDFSGVYNYLDIKNIADVGGLVIGRYDGMLDGTDPVVIGNTADVTINTATSIAGPISIYGGSITLNSNLTTTNNGDISLYTDNPIGGLSTPRTLTASGAFKYIPRGSSFAADVTYPITNLTATCTGLTIGKSTNDKNITINADVTGGAGIELYGGDIAINSNLITTDGAAMYLKGNTTIAAGKYIESNGNFTHDGDITFKSDATGTAVFGPLGGTYTALNNSKAIVERYIPARRAWRLLTAPTKGSTSNTVQDNWQGTNGEGVLLWGPSGTGLAVGPQNNIYSYNGAWTPVTNTTTTNLFDTDKNNAFLVFAVGPHGGTNIPADNAAVETTLRPKGSLITGNISYTGLTTNTFHLIANPYASPISTSALKTTNSDFNIWLLDPSLGTIGGYYTYDGNNWTPETPAGDAVNIQSGQGFFVRSASASSFNVNESHKAVGNSNTWFAKPSVQTTEENKIRVLLDKQINNEWQLADGILSVSGNSYSNEVDAQDALKVTNFNENIQFRNGTNNIAIEYQNLPTATTEQPIRLTGTTATSYRLRVRTEGFVSLDLQPILQDTQSGTNHLIPTDGTTIEIPFTGVVSTTTNPDQRFKIVYQQVLGVEQPINNTLQVYPNPVTQGQFVIALPNSSEVGSYEITNYLGQVVQKGNLTAGKTNVSIASQAVGVYLVRVQQNGEVYTTKIVKK